MTDHSLFRRWVKQLRKEFPGRFPVRVYLVDGTTLTRDHGRAMCGDCDFDDGDESNGSTARCTIRIDKKQNATTTRDTLAEEWAHYLQYHLLPESCREPEHSPVFAAIYGAILVRLRGDLDDKESASQGNWPGHASGRHADCAGAGG